MSTCIHRMPSCMHNLSTCMHNMHYVNMHAQHDYVNMHAQHALCQHACTTYIPSICIHNLHNVNMHAQLGYSQHACSIYMREVACANANCLLVPRQNCSTCARYSVLAPCHVVWRTSKVSTPEGGLRDLEGSAQEHH